MNALSFERYGEDEWVERDGEGLDGLGSLDDMDEAWMMMRIRLSWKRIDEEENVFRLMRAYEERERGVQVLRSKVAYP